MVTGGGHEGKRERGRGREGEWGRVTQGTGEKTSSWERCCGAKAGEPYTNLEATWGQNHPGHQF